MPTFKPFLGQNLRHLTLTTYDAPRSYQLDHLSCLTQLRTLQVESEWGTNDITWATQGLLSSLVNLSSVQLQLGHSLSGPYMQAFGALPQLTELVCSAAPSTIQSAESSYTALQSLVISDTDFMSVPLHFNWFLTQVSRQLCQGSLLVCSVGLNCLGAT